MLTFFLGGHCCSSLRKIRCTNCWTLTAEITVRILSSIDCQHLLGNNQVTKIIRALAPGTMNIHAKFHVDLASSCPYNYSTPKCWTDQQTMSSFGPAADRDCSELFAVTILIHRSRPSWQSATGGQQEEVSRLWRQERRSHDPLGGPITTQYDE